MFGFIKDKIKKVYSTITQQVSGLFAHSKLDEQFLKDLSALLINADTGVKTTHEIINQLKDAINHKQVNNLEQAKEMLEIILIKQLQTAHTVNNMPAILLLVGVNGSGKTTFVAKLANMLKNDGKRVLIVAGDTFRAAATQQLAEWAQRLSVDIFIGKDAQDPASVIFDACKKFQDDGYDHLIIDTAGRLQTKINLMRELEKIERIVGKQLPNTPHQTWLTIDAMLGQNSLAQAETFYEATKVNGLVLTKLDGTGKGGIVFSIVQKLHIPIVYVTFGETLEDIKSFDIQEYVHGLLNE
jgi:fused signal recognition particle receptor